MKQLASILFLGILAFNFYGYQLLISCVEHNNEIALEKRLDNHEYNNDDLISIKTPLNLPYSTNSISYERAYGSVNVNGVDYEYVKTRVHNDTLELLCLPNQVKTELQAVKSDLVKISLEGQQSNKKSSNHSNLKISLPDYFQEISCNGEMEFQSNGQQINSFLNNSLKVGYQFPQERPPQPMHNIS